MYLSHCVCIQYLGAAGRVKISKWCALGSAGVGGCHHTTVRVEVHAAAIGLSKGGREDPVCLCVRETGLLCKSAITIIISATATAAAAAAASRELLL
jgi:hypothetical protein